MVVLIMFNSFVACPPVRIRLRQPPLDLCEKEQRSVRNSIGGLRRLLALVSAHSVTQLMMITTLLPSASRFARHLNAKSQIPHQGKSIHGDSVHSR